MNSVLKTRNSFAKSILIIGMLLALFIILVAYRIYHEFCLNEPLWLAVQSLHTEDVKRLLVAGADPNTRAEDGTPVIILAERYGEKEVVRLLKQAGAKE